MIARAFAKSRKDLHWGELIEMKKSVRSNMSIIDIGCGTGRLLNELPDHIDYTGIDSSVGQIDQARQIFPVANFLVASMLHLPFDDSRFDIAFMIAGLHHLSSAKSRKQALDEAFRVLKPGGDLFITVMNFWRWKYRGLFFHKVTKNLTQQQKKQVGLTDIFWPWRWQSEQPVYRYYYAFRKSELGRLVSSAGFKIDKLAYMRNDRQVKFYRANNLVVHAIKKYN